MKHEAAAPRPASSAAPLATAPCRGGASDRRPTVLLADDHPMMLEGLRKLLAPGFDVVGAVANGRDLVAAAEELHPDLVLADLSMPEIDGIEAIRQLRAASPGTRVLILSIHTEPSWVRSAFEAGACGYLTKTSPPEEIEGALREVLRGHFYVCPAVAQAVVGLATESSVRGLARRAREVLTRRELEIVRLVGRGLGNKEIALRLGMSVTTVRTHLRKVYEKLGVASRLELALRSAHHELG